MSGGKKVSVYDYPEHLNPFHEEDNHSKLKFWTLGRKKGRSSSFSMAGFKDFRNTWNFKSFTKKGRRELQEKNGSQTIYSNIPSESPIQYRKPVSETSSNTLTRDRTVSTPQVNSYVYKGSITPLPRFRFQERGSIGDNRLVEENVSPPRRQRTISTTSNPAPYLAELNEKLEVRGSRTSLQSQFEDGHNSSIRASARKKRRAPPPPPLRVSSIPGTPDITVTDTSDNTLKYTVTSIPLKGDFDNTTCEDIHENLPFLNVELKIVEEDDTDNREVTVNTEPTATFREISADPKNDLPASSNMNHVDERTSIENEQVPPDNKAEITTSITQIIELQINEDELGNDKIEGLNKNNSEEMITEKVMENLQSTDNDRISIRKKPNHPVNNNDDIYLPESIDCQTVTCSKIAAKKAEYERDIQYLSRSISLQNDPDEVFPKVDAIAYKRRQSLQQESQTKVDPTLIEELPLTSVDDSAELNISNDSNSTSLNNNIAENFAGSSDAKDISQSQLVKCKIHEDSKYYINKNAHARNEFFDVIKKNEQETIPEDKEESNNYKRPSVLDMKLLFDTQENGSPADSDMSTNSPNPLPKPRRTKITSNRSSSSESFKFESCPMNPIINKTFSDRL